MATRIATRDAATPSARSPVVTLSDFLREEYDKPAPLLSPWLRRGDLSMVYAPTGVGKTWFTLGVAWAVATGSPFATWNGHGYRKHAKGHRVLVMDFEMAVSELQDRLQKVRERSARDVSAEADRRGQKNLSVYAVTRLASGQHLSDLSKPQECEELVRLAEGFDLVIIDNLSTSMKPEDENRPDSFYHLQEALLELRRQGKAVILVHHTNKSGDQRGSSAKTTVLNTVLSLTKLKPDRGIGWGVMVKFEKHRNLIGDEKSPVELWVEATEDGEERWRTEATDIDLHSMVVRWHRKQLCRNQTELAQLLSAVIGDEVTQQQVSRAKTAAISRGMIGLRDWNRHQQAAKNDPDATNRLARELIRLSGGE
ncbi:AAA family ATPase [Parvularcula sp. ZS-1/3]|uniref:AAA family ATPase n=2 Tax=Parvularcula mediterranea TaxID=2732508 RepID=A0A7Y3RJB0_9PROT|nr:AAA family ATPase [Parvularcula mediterranea]NNU15109.1 AAA family ATPase [Parvularcula mediterranea]